MGLFISRILGLIQSNKPCRILMVGLDAAGKTTLLYKFKLSEVITSIPTIGFNVETVEYKNLSFTVWDVGGQKILRPLWQHYFQNTQAVIYVVDSSDSERFEEAKEELDFMLESFELKDCPLLVYANKQDLPQAVKTGVLANALGLDTMKNRKWFVQPCCAINGTGIYEGFDWLASNIE